MRGRGRIDSEVSTSTTSRYKVQDEKMQQGSLHTQFAMSDAGDR
jgi:hypothetical protein